MSRTYAITRNVPTTTINGCNTVLSSHSSTLTCDGGWYYVGMKKVAAAQGALNRIWTFLSTSASPQGCVDSISFVFVCAVYL